MLLPGELVCRAGRNIPPQPCHQVIRSKLTTATGSNSHQKENVVVKLNVRKTLLQTLMACEASPKRELSLLSPAELLLTSIPGCHLPRARPCTGVPLWGADGAGFAVMPAQPCCLWQLQPHFVRFLWHFWGTGWGWVQMGRKFCYLRWTHWSSEVWM